MPEKRAPSDRKTKATAAKTTARRAAKPAGAVERPPRARRAAEPEPSPEERWRMVAEAAYYIAEKRGFVGGDPAQDWYEAEKQVAAFLHETQKSAKKRAGA